MNASTGRVLWIIFCLLWAAFWFFVALATAITVIGLFGGLLMAAASVAAILIPVGIPSGHTGGGIPQIGIFETKMHEHPVAEQQTHERYR